MGGTVRRFVLSAALLGLVVALGWSLASPAALGQARVRGPGPTLGQDPAREPEDSPKVTGQKFDLSGEWIATDGNSNHAASLKQELNRVSGTYEYQKGSVEGTVEGNVVKLRWDQ